MSEGKFNEILEKICLEDYSFSGEAPIHHFSARHRRRMKRILDMPYSAPQTSRRIHLNRRTVLVLIAAVFLAAILTGAAIVFFSGGFAWRKHSDNTQLFAYDMDSAPSVIEDIYCPTWLPEGYVEVDRVEESKIVEIVYQYKGDTDNTITFCQYVKSKFVQHFSTEKYPLESVSVGEHKGLFVDASKESYVFGQLIWDNGGYIMSIDGNITKNDAIKMSNSTEISEQ